jgi:hypothetical protein
MEVPACCPRCGAAYVWELGLAVDRELAWAAPDALCFRFRCASCAGEVRVGFAWQLERGSAARPLRLVGGPAPLPASPRILLVDHCPHGCGARLALQLEPDDPLLAGRVWPHPPHQPLVLGGYRCPRCDGEGRLRLAVEVSAG